MLLSQVAGAAGGMKRVREGSQQAGTEPPRQAQVSSASWFPTVYLPQVYII